MDLLLAAAFFRVDPTSSYPPSITCFFDSADVRTSASFTTQQTASHRQNASAFLRGQSDYPVILNILDVMLDGFLLDLASCREEVGPYI